MANQQIVSLPNPELVLVTVEHVKQALGVLFGKQINLVAQKETRITIREPRPISTDAFIEQEVLVWVFFCVGNHLSEQRSAFLEFALARILFSEGSRWTPTDRKAVLVIDEEVTYQVQWPSSDSGVVHIRGKDRESEEDEHELFVSGTSHKDYWPGEPITGPDTEPSVG